MEDLNRARRPGTPTPLTLPGRQGERALLQQCLASSCDGRGRLVLISGDAGIGKTTLVRSVFPDVLDKSALIHSSACYDLMVTPPFGPWSEIFQQLHDDGTPFPPPWHHERAVEESTSTPDALFAEAIERLTLACEQQPRVLVLDDLHWADQASLEFLRFLARRLEQIPALVIGTYRDNEIGRDHPLATHLPGLVRESLTTRIALRPLDEDGISELVDQLYQVSLSDQSRLVTYLSQRTEGNPFFIGELLRSLEEAGDIQQLNGGWVVGDLRQTPVPALIRQVIESRLSKLNDQTRQLLRSAAVLGQEIVIDLWREVAGSTDSNVDEAIRDGLDLQILEETDSLTRIRFSHALIREALYLELGLPERRDLHRLIGEIQSRQTGADPDVVAFHLNQAGDQRATEWLMRAGERAQRMYAWRIAADRFNSVLQQIELNTDLLHAQAWLGYRTGLLLTYADPTAGIEHLHRAEEIATVIGDAYLSASARADRGLLRCLTGDVRRGLMEMQSGVNELDAVPVPDRRRESSSAQASDILSVESIQRGTLELVSTDETLNVRQGALVFWLAWAGRYQEAVRIGEQFVEDAGSSSGGSIQDAIGDALAGLGHAWAARGKPDEALSAFARARDTYAAIDHHFKVGNTAIYELSEAFLPYRADQVIEREWLADQAEAG